MKKLNWAIDFLDFVESRHDTPFTWGTNDCAIFAADATMTMGVPDPVPNSRGKYSTEAGAKRHLKSQYGDLYAVWDRVFERLENVNYAQNGDVVLFDGDLGLTCGIYWNGGVFAPAMEGIRLVGEQHSKLLAAWRV